MFPRPILRPDGTLGEQPQDSGAGFAPLSPPPLPQDLLLQFSPLLTPEQQAAILASVGGHVAETIHAPAPGEAGGLLVRVEIAPGHSIAEAVDILATQPGVDFAEPNDVVAIAGPDTAGDGDGHGDGGDWVVSVAAISNDPGYLNGSLWNMQGDQTAIKNQFGSQAGEAWSAGYTGTMKTVVGTVDTGIDYTHIDLYLNIWLNQGEIPKSFRAQLKDIDGDGLITFRDLNDKSNAGFVSDKNGNGRIDAGDLLKDTRWADGTDQDGDGYKDDLIGWDFANNDNDPFDDNGHGTHVAGTIGATGGNGVGVAGVDWNVQIVATKFLAANGSGTTANAVKAIDYFTTVSKLAPASENFVATNNSWGGGGASTAVADAIARAAKADILFIAAAGNNGTNNDTTANYPSNYDTKAAAGYDSVIAVASITSTGALSSFSDYGRAQVDLAAPGSSIYSTLPGDTYGTLSGTSMATPLVTGAAALYASAHPDATAAQIKAAILGSVDYTASLNGLVATNGRLDIGNLLNVAPVKTPGEIVQITAVMDNVGASQGKILAGGTTDDLTPTLQGSLSATLAGDESLAIYRNGAKVGLAALNGSSWSFTDTVAEGSYSYTARVENTGGGLGAFSSAYGFTVSLPPTSIYGTAASETLSGTAGRDIISGLPGTGSFLGKASIDKLFGGAGNDIFLLGDARGVFYDDGIGNSAGAGDYAQIMDFQTGDQIQLSTKIRGYYTSAVTLGGVSGLGVYADLNANGRFDAADELIGHLAGVTRALVSSDIVWA